MDTFVPFVKATGGDDIEMFEERHVGICESEKEFTCEIVHECFKLEEHGFISLYVDYKPTHTKSSRRIHFRR